MKDEQVLGVDANSSVAEYFLAQSGGSVRTLQRGKKGPASGGRRRERSVTKEREKKDKA